MRPRPSLFAALALALSLLIVNCARGGTHPSARPSADPSSAAPQARVLGIASNPRPIPSPGVKDLIAGIELSASVGARGRVVSYDWSKLEPSPGTFALSSIGDGIRYLGDRRGDTMLVSIRTLNTTTREVPTDLKDIAFDSPQMRRRFHALLDALKPYLDEHVAYMSLGNEVDVYLSAHPSEWAAYDSFIRDSVAYMHVIAPGIKTGVTVTFGGASSPNSGQIAQLIAPADVSIVTYYPATPDFQFTQPAAPLSDFPTMLVQAGDKPVVLAEVGFSSSPQLGSSEAIQAAFVTNVYRAWAKAGTRIPFLSFFMLHDFPPDACDNYAQYYGLPNNKNFIAYLCSLGLRRTDGSPKAAWDAFVAGAKDMR